MREYLQRKRLASLGMTSDLGKFPAWKIDAFYRLDIEFDELIKKKAERDAKKRRKR